jgi:hypothetical protein
MVLTRGLDAISTNFLPNPVGDMANASNVQLYRTMLGWVDKFAGAYARTQPKVEIGLLYSHRQATMRAINQADNTATDSNALHVGSHEGMVTEGLVMCQAAQRPARAVTLLELDRIWRTLRPSCFCLG